jgi:hypothetical protein
MANNSVESAISFEDEQMGGEVLRCLQEELYRN